MSLFAAELEEPKIGMLTPSIPNNRCASKTVKFGEGLLVKNTMGQGENVGKRGFCGKS